MLLLLQRPVEGIRDRLYGFVTYTPKHMDGPDKGRAKTNMALDISFGSSGYALVLARAFRKVNVHRRVVLSITLSCLSHGSKCHELSVMQVISVNFHPFFRNENKPVKKRAFYTNYVDVNLPVDIFTQEQTNINEV